MNPNPQKARKTLTRTALAAGISLALAACGGGGGSGGSSNPVSTPPTSTPPSTPTTQAKTTGGKITGFGSVYVNGVRWDTSSTSYSVDDDESVLDDSALAVGMVVKVEGTINEDGQSGVADGH